MFVYKSMTRNVAKVAPDTPILEAQALMKEQKIRHLPVVDAENRVVGLVSDRDMRSAMPSSLLSASDYAAAEAALAAEPVEKIMTRDPVTVSPIDTIQDVIVLRENIRVGAFPVVDGDKKLQGIISVVDLDRAFVNLLGIVQPGSLLSIVVPEEVGQMKRIVDAVTEENISFGSILVNPHWDTSKRAVFIYLLTNNVARVKNKLKEIGYELLNPIDWNIDQLTDESPG